jgi:hypothetical protein
MAQTSKALDKLVRRLLKSAAFRRKLARDPAAALRELKIYSAKRLRAVKRLDLTQLQALARAFGYDKYFKGLDAN